MTEVIASRSRDGQIFILGPKGEAAYFTGQHWVSIRSAPAPLTGDDLARYFYRVPDHEAALLFLEARIALGDLRPAPLGSRRDEPGDVNADMPMTRADTPAIFRLARRLDTDPRLRALLRKALGDSSQET